MVYHKQNNNIRLTVELKSSKIWLRIFNLIQGAPQGAYSKYVPCGATKKTIKKARLMGGFILIGSLRDSEINKSTIIAPDFNSYSRRVNGSILKYVPIGATKKTS